MILSDHFNDRSVHACNFNSCWCGRDEGDLFVTRWDNLMELFLEFSHIVSYSYDLLLNSSWKRTWDIVYLMLELLFYLLKHDSFIMHFPIHKLNTFRLCVTWSYRGMTNNGILSTYFRRWLSQNWRNLLSLGLHKVVGLGHWLNRYPTARWCCLILVRRCLWSFLFRSLG